MIKNFSTLIKGINEWQKEKEAAAATNGAADKWWWWRWRWLIDVTLVVIVIDIVGKHQPFVAYERRTRLEQIDHVDIVFLVELDLGLIVQPQQQSNKIASTNDRHIGSCRSSSKAFVACSSSGSGGRSCHRFLGHARLIFVVLLLIVVAVVVFINNARFAA